MKVNVSFPRIITDPFVSFRKPSSVDAHQLPGKPSLTMQVSKSLPSLATHTYSSTTLKARTDWRLSFLSARRFNMKQMTRR